MSAYSTAASQTTSDTSLIGDTLNAMADNIQEKSMLISDLTRNTLTPNRINLFTNADNDTFRSTYQILSDISSVWNDMDTRILSPQEEVVLSISITQHSIIFKTTDDEFILDITKI